MLTGASGSSSGAVRDAVRTLNPGYFALVMATGILSITMHYRGAYGLSVALMWVGIAAYVILIVLNAWRALRYRHDVAADFADARHGFAFFTFVAATDVLGSRLAADGHLALAIALLAVGSLAWVVLGYVLPWTSVLGHQPRPLLEDANGSWFIWPVASQSVAVLAATVEPSVTVGRRELALLAVLAWAVGVALYAAVGVFVASRLLVYPLRPADLTAHYWVAMGATAITVVAGARIVQMSDAPVAEATRGLVAGTVVIFWAFGTWLIPLLVIAGIWRHAVHRFPLRYDAAVWSLVFPLGMYGVGGEFAGKADHLPILRAIGVQEGWVALAVWALAFAAMLHHLGHTLRRRPAG